MARQLARTFHAPVRLLRLVPAGAAPPPSRPNAAPSLEGVVSHVLGLQADIRTLPADDPAEALARDAAPGDILLLGAPSPLRITAGFSGSIPERVGARIPSSLVLLHRPASAPTDLRRILWGRLAQPRQRAASPRDAIASLVENLARHHQLPSSCTTDFVRRALLREQEMTTGVGGSTAFPHVRLRSFSGVAASFGVFPEGVDFQAVDGNPCNFLCFLVSSHGYSNEYLSILARFARRMLLPDVREALLRCATSEAIMDILEPQIVLPSIPATLSLKGGAP
jgi:mannitol/fructose-specific phosphotransferase system IIA component (Ntr-type)